MKVTANRRARVAIVASVIAAGALPACGVEDALAQLSQTQRDAISFLNELSAKLTSESGDWQAFIEDQLGSVSQEVRDIVAGELNALVQMGIGAAATEIRCTVDFIGVRIGERIARFRNRLLSSWDIDVDPLPPLIPNVCQVVPDVIDRERDLPDAIRFYGWNFDTVAPVSAVLKDSSGQEVDITDTLADTTPYEVTMDLGKGGVPLSDSSRRIIVSWDISTLDRPPEHTLIVSQPHTPVCSTKEVKFDGETSTIFPLLISGDREFYGHGPAIDIGVHIENVSTGIVADVRMAASEVGGSTYAEVGRRIVLYAAPVGWAVQGIPQSPTEYSYPYTDTDWEEDFKDFGPGDIVRKFTVLGDTFGDDVGDTVGDTSVRIDFATEIPVELVETGNCVPKA